MLARYPRLFQQPLPRREDIGNALDVTIGMHSPSFDGHRLSMGQEMTIYNHHRVADRYLWG